MHAATPPSAPSTVPRTGPTHPGPVAEPAARASETPAPASGTDRTERTSAARAELIRVLGRVRLPDFPAQHQRILDAIRDEHCPPRELAERVALSPAISVQVLRVVNSAAFSLRARVSSIPHAIALLGRVPLENLVRSLGARGALPRWPARFFDRTTFWRGCARRATTARALAEQLEPHHAELAFTGALLADIAVPLLVKARPRTYRDLLSEARGSGTALARLEKEAFGFTHGEVGGLLATAWGFPGALQRCIAGHHGTTGAPEVPLAVGLVAHLGDEPDARLDLDPLMVVACQHHGLPPELIRSAVRAGVRRSQELAHTLA